MNLKKYIRSIPDYPKKGILFRDITTLIKNPDAFNYSIDKIINISKKIQFDKIAAIESRGFVFASAVSYLTKKPFILLRKKNKLPAERYSVDFQLEYGEATIEVHKDSILNNENETIICNICNKFEATNNRSLGAHQKGCRRKHKNNQSDSSIVVDTSDWNSSVFLVLLFQLTFRECIYFS